MKINCGPSKAAKLAAKAAAEKAETLRQREWHDFFAWWPRRVGGNDCRWLEMIERRSVVVRHIPAHQGLWLMGRYFDIEVPARDEYGFDYRGKK